MADQATSGHLIVSARPRFEVEGEEKSQLATDLIRLEVTHDEDGMARLEAVFVNWGPKDDSSPPTFKYFDGQILDFGKRLVVKAGADDNQATIFEGRVTGLAASFPDLRAAEIRVLAEDALQLMRLTERSRFYEQEDESGIVSTIASDHGLSGNADASGTKHKEFWQVNQNDLAFLRERARAADARIDVSGQNLVFTPRRSPGSGDPIRLSKENELIRFEAIADLAHQRSEVHVHGWSIADKDGIHETADVNDAKAEARGGKIGSDILSDVGWTAVEHLHLEAPATSDEARALAKSLSLRRARRFLYGRGTTDGTPLLAVGSEVELLDIGDWFSGRWTVCAVRHTFDLVQGLRTHFSAERVDIGRGS